MDSPRRYFLRITFGPSRTVLDVLPRAPLSLRLGCPLESGWLHTTAAGEAHALGAVSTFDDARHFVAGWLPGASEQREGQGDTGDEVLLRFVETTSPLVLLPAVPGPSARSAFG